MRFLLAFIYLVNLTIAFADEVKVEINPPKPVVGEVFQAYFRVFTDSDEEPVINFSPSGVEVVGKSNQGVSTRTIYSNGQLTVTREMTYVYDLVANKTGVANLRDINVQLGSKVLRHSSISLTVLKEAEETAEIFIQADFVKKEYFVGEGIVVRYYLYHKGSARNVEVKTFPKLNNFLKRFLQEPERPERVTVNGEQFQRNQIYCVKLFPEKTGELKIDSLYASASYAASRDNDPFGAFGFSRDLKTKSLSSEAIKIIVKPLPEPVPANFTGLIGKHDFELEIGSSRLIVNEPMEVKLTISGGGALENLEAPVIIKNPGLEDFESNGDLKITNTDHAIKTFNYTFLAKENLKLPATTTSLSYFDPATMRYVSTTLNIPEIVVAGGSGEAKKDKPVEPQASQSDSKKFELPQIPKDFAGPILVDGKSLKSYLPYLNLALAALSLCVALTWLVKSRSLPSFKASQDVPSQFKKGEFSMGEFTRWLSPLIQKTGKSPLTIIKESDMDKESKAYFVELLNSNDYKDYSTRKTQGTFTYKSLHFKNLSKYIESAKHENTSQPT